ncbi:MAG: T9SS type A sorting domain-containing protein [Candidatus Cloacimonadaceae bacterium]
MKKDLLLILALTILISVVFAEDYMKPGPRQNAIPIANEPTRILQPSRSHTCIYQFSINPMTLIMSYYDYMIGGYNDLPVCVQPDPTYGGYFLTFHVTRTANAQRRVFYAYISDTGTVENIGEITNAQNWEGYPSLSVDPVSGKPIYAWHTDLPDGPIPDPADEYEVQLAWDAFFSGSAGLLSDPPFTVIDNPITMPEPYNTTDNEFIWPTVQIGPSPNAGMRRVYVLARNAVTHTTYPSENPYIIFADFNADMLEMGTPLVWNHTTIPTMDAWNHDTVLFRRPNMAFTVGNDGKIYYVGYHIASILTPTETDLYEPDLDAFVCDNYGEGTWQRYTGVSRWNSWNPHDNYGSGEGIFQVPDGNPVPDDSVFWEIYNSSHLNAVMDNDNSMIHQAVIYAHLYRGMESGEIKTYWHPTQQTVRDLVYDVNTHEFSVREIYPMAGTPTDILQWNAYDTDGDGLVDEFYTNPDDPDDINNGYPLMVSTWPFPYWDYTVHSEAMYFHYSNVKITEPNDQGMMAAVWQDCDRARLYNLYPTEYPEYAPFSDTPEIFISCSPDYGMHWSEPISLNKVETPQLANMKPMWVYPADKVKYVTTTDDRKVGKLALMFYDDLSWGAYNIEGPVGQNSGGYVKFCELNITFPNFESNEDHVAPALSFLKNNYPNPFNSETTIRFTLPKKGNANLSIYNTKGQLVKTLHNGMTKAGETSLTWNGTDNQNQRVSNGIYFYKLNANGKVETRKMMLLK